MANDKEIRPQSAVIPYREGKEGLEFLLVTSLDTGRWVLPKGHLAAGLTPSGSAEREAYEEAGIEGTVETKAVGAYRYAKLEVKGGGLRRVEVFPMEVRKELDAWPEQALRKRQWMTPDEAAKAVAEKKLSKILLTFAESLPKREKRN